MSTGSQGPSQDPVYEAQFVEPEPPSRPKKTTWAGILTIGVFVGLLFGPVLYTWLPAEIARWHHAAAKEQRVDGDLDGALQSIDRAIAQFPERDDLRVQRVSWLREKGEYATALEECNQLVDKAPQDVDALLLRSQILQNLGRFNEAVEDNESAVEMSPEARPNVRGTLLNGLAYSRALAKSRLGDALDEIEQSIAIIGEDPALLDTRGFIRYLRGEYDEARKDLDRSVSSIETLHAALTKAYNGEELGLPDRRDGKLELERAAQSVAVIRYHRLLVLTALGDDDGAEADRQRVQELGFEPTPALF